MSIERRLHHAARELRELPIDVPEPPAASELAGRARPLAGATFVASLFVVAVAALGALALLRIDLATSPGDDPVAADAMVEPGVTALANPPSRVIEPARAASPQSSFSVDVSDAPGTLTALEEIALITSIQTPDGGAVGDAVDGVGDERPANAA